MKISFRALAGLALAACAFASCAPAQVTPQELEKMARQRTGDGVTVPFGGFADIEAEGQRLAQKYNNDPESQGRIYSGMALIYGVSGTGLANEKSLEYAQKALACPLQPRMRLHMYVYWGDALQLAHGPVAGDKLAAVRREAVMPYLLGLKEAVAFNLPDDPPELPAADQTIRFSGPPEIAAGIKREMDAKRKAYVEAKRVSDLVEVRETLIGQIVYMYSRKPFGTDELSALATQVIGNDHSIGRLMAAVEEAVNERTTAGGPGTPYMVKVMPKFREAAQPANAEQPATAGTSKP